MDDFGWDRSPLAAVDEHGAPGTLTIDLKALARNYAGLCKLAKPARAAAVVKADAYGLGADRVAPVLYQAGCRHFFVAQFGEALALRSRLPSDALIFVLNGLQPDAEQKAVETGIVPVINSLEQWRRWSSAAQVAGRILPAVLQVDSGMSRLGVSPEERGRIRAELDAGSRLDILFLMSHLASAEDADSAQNCDQLNEVAEIKQEFPEFPLSFANSGGVFLGADYHGTLVRPGLALYGGAPVQGLSNPMESIVRLDVAVVQTRTVPAGTRIGYGGAHVAAKKMRLATLAAGYADGLLRSLSDRGAVYHHGFRLPIVGRVSMDSTTVDASALPAGALSLGSLVEVIGPHQSLEDLAMAAGTISYEILTGLGRRYRRRYL